MSGKPDSGCNALWQIKKKEKEKKSNIQNIHQVADGSEYNHLVKFISEQQNSSINLPDKTQQLDTMNAYLHVILEERDKKIPLMPLRSANVNF